ncbi:MAG: S8 family serine peptidase [Eisenbergiella sp.]
MIALLDTGAGLSENVISQVSLIGDELISPNLQHGKTWRMPSFQNADARILSIRVLDGEGRGTVSSIAAGIEYAIAQNADYINLSLYAKNTLTTSVVAEEIRKAVNEGIVVTGAAGNSSDSGRLHSGSG